MPITPVASLVRMPDPHDLRAALREVVAEAAYQRCYVHFLRSALDYVPRRVDDDCLQELRWLYDRRDLPEARRDLAGWLAKWSGRYSKLTGWVEDNIDETLTFYRLPRQHHKRLKSTNMLERLNEEIRRRSIHDVGYEPVQDLDAAVAPADFTPRGNHRRRDRERDELAAAHRSGSLLRNVEEKARAYPCFGGRVLLCPIPRCSSSSTGSSVITVFRFPRPAARKGSTRLRRCRGGGKIRGGNGLSKA